LDSIADDLMILIAIVGLIVFKNEFIREQLFLIIILLGLYLFQLCAALIRYRKPTSFHTYLAKAAMITQGVFFILVFFLPQPPLLIFYIAAGVTILDLLEEILLVFLLPTWKPDVKGWLWLKKTKAV
ncbi:MAG: CDP-alcohol phosphatidyltransferase family protein, partial [Chitinophagaceae bacterium]